MKYIFVAITFLSLIACTPAPATPFEGMIQTAVAQAVNALPTITPYPTYTPVPTQTPWIILITPTSSPTPLHTPTETLTPTITFTPEPTQDPLYLDHEPGIYLVNVDIAPGVWRSLGSGGECYWQRSDKTGDIIDNHYGFAGGTIYISTSDFSVQLDTECGTWTFLSPP